MSLIQFPQFLEHCLKTSALHPAIRTFADRVGELVSANKTPFFPEYTDHGVDHLNAVLNSAVELIPKEVRDNVQQGQCHLFTDADATVLIGAVLLHDIAMHLRPAGFLELISPQTVFKVPSKNTFGDRPWPELWADYQHEARRFTDEKLTQLLGEEQARKFRWRDLPEDPEIWCENTKRIIGEFLRRHHPRLAHEVVCFGFPGFRRNDPYIKEQADSKSENHKFDLQLTSDEMLEPLPDLIGITARSHGIDLRRASKYLNEVYHNQRRFYRVVPVYLMALLRIADYMQIEKNRAPAILLNLDKPQSPVSINEWNKHQAVRGIDEGTSSEARSVTVNRNLTHATFLQLRTLLQNMQQELDKTNALLAQILSTSETHHLRLNLRSIESDLDRESFLGDLPYVPEETRFAADPNILTLLVEPLYGKNPSVGVRELLQNAIDAVREHKVLCEKRGVTLPPIDGADSPDTDVLVEYIEDAEGKWTLRIQDRGVGMTPSTIRDYFLKAGVSFRCSSDWVTKHLDQDRKANVTRTGRFGIGVFAVFLLGDSFELCTRSYQSKDAQGSMFRAKKNQSAVTIKRLKDKKDIGTTISVTLHSSAVPTYANPNSFPNIASQHWYTARWPAVAVRIRPFEKAAITLKQPVFTPLSDSSEAQHADDWNKVPNPKLHYTAWSWKFDTPELTVNGFVISTHPEDGSKSKRWSWLQRDQNLVKHMFSPDFLRISSPPSIACEDRAQELPLLANRYGLEESASSFFRSTEVDCIYSILAFALVHGPKAPGSAFDPQLRHPLQQSNEMDVVWVTTKSGFAVFDAGILTHCVQERHILILHHVPLEGLSRDQRLQIHNRLFDRLWKEDPLQNAAFSFQIMHWDVKDYSDPNWRLVDYSDVREDHQGAINKSIEALSHGHGRLRYLDLATESTLEASIADVAKEMGLHIDTDEVDYITDIFSFAEITFAEVPDEPPSTMGKIWKETLGPTGIPFDQVGRNELIKKARGNPAMARHLEKWERIKPPGNPQFLGDA